MLSVACVLPVENDRVWLVRRALPPGIGSWSLAGGFVEAGESIEEAAVREALEELGASVKLLDRLGTYIDANTGRAVHVYRCQLLGDPVDTAEAYDACAFTRETIPWSDLAFQSDTSALKDYCLESGHRLKEA